MRYGHNTWYVPPSLDERGGQFILSQPVSSLSEDVDGQVEIQSPFCPVCRNFDPSQTPRPEVGEKP